MPALVLVPALVALVGWVAWTLLPARRWPTARVLPTAGSPEGDALEIRAVVPARNEATSLPTTLPVLLAQGPPLRSAILVDDRSADRTGEVARTLGRDAPSPLEVVRVEAVPPDWAGKVHAMATGLEAVDRRWEGPASERWVFFTDADIRQPPNGVARFAARATAGSYDLVSVMARLRTECFWERMLVPAFVWFFQAMYPFRRAEDPRSRVAAAAGGAMLVRRETLARAGGPAAWKGALIDDLALARGIKDAGGRIWIGFADDVVSTRAYPTLASLVDMVARSAFVELRYRYVLVPLVWLALLVIFVAPPVALVAGVFLERWPLAVVGGAGWTLQLLHVLPAFRHHRVSAGHALLMPGAALLYAWMTTVSAWRHLRGRARTWRG